MSKFIRHIEVRWADLDPNFHMLHSKYYDLGAYVRMCLFHEFGITANAIQEFKVGPILFREECVFRKEINFGDKVSVDAELVKMKKDGSRWSIQHRIMKNDDKLTATISVDGAWMSLETRKLATPPQSFVDVLLKFPRPSEFIFSE
jgi:acyl-CoA thioester hydrolase